MLDKKLTILISTCNAYSDLWDIHLELLKRNWPDREASCILVTDSPVDRQFENVSVFSAGSKLEMPQRLKEVLKTIDTEYVLITLDDYFPVKTITSVKIEKALSVMEKEKLDYLRLWPYPRSKQKMAGQDGFYWISYDSNYQVNLYPGIWRKSFLEKTFHESLSAWMYEVSLTAIAKRENAKSALSLNGEFPFLDVIRKGKILHKAKAFLDNNGYSLNREVISWEQELKLNLMYYCKEYLPKSLLRRVKSIMEKRGYKFFSDGI